MIREGSRPNKRAHFDMKTSVTISISVSQSEAAEKVKKKKQKRVEKKVKPQPLIEMFDDSKKVYDKFILVRQVLKKSKIDLF